MILRIIAVIKRGKETIGYRLFDEESGTARDFGVNDTMMQISKNGCVNAHILRGEIISTECSFDRFTVLDEDLNLVKDQGFIVSKKYVKDGKTVGYDLINFRGMRNTVKKEVAENLLASRGGVNATLMKTTTGHTISGIKAPIRVVDVDSKSTSDIKEAKPVVANVSMGEVIVDGNRTFCIDLEDMLGNITKDFIGLAKDLGFCVTNETQPNMYMDVIKYTYSADEIINRFDLLLKRANVRCKKVEIFYDNSDKNVDLIKRKNIAQLTSSDLSKMTPELCKMLDFMLNNSSIVTDQINWALNNPILAQRVRK